MTIEKEYKPFKVTKISIETTEAYDIIFAENEEDALKKYQCQAALTNSYSKKLLNIKETIEAKENK